MNPTCPISPELWHQGLHPEVFVQGMQHNQAVMQSRIQSVQISPEEQQAFNQIKKPLRALVLTEDWCGDSLMNLPILFAVLRALPQAKCRIFPRSQWPRLQEYFVARGFEFIPTICFLNDQYDEVGMWMERPQAAHERVSAWKAAHPEIQAVRSDPTLSEEDKRARLRHLGKAQQAEMQVWYDQEGLQQETVRELYTLLSK